MKKHIIFFSLIVIITFFSFSSFAQVKNITSYEDLIRFQNSITSASASAIVYGYFNGWGKFGWDSHKNICSGVLNSEEYSGLLSALNFKLFSDKITTYYLPIAKSAKIVCDYKSDDIIKLKIKLYKDCKINNGKVFFLIQEIL